MNNVHVHCNNAYNSDSIITDDTIITPRKFPFIRVLTWTYLITEMDSAEACSTLISTKYIFVAIQIFYELIINFTETFGNFWSILIPLSIIW